MQATEQSRRSARWVSLAAVVSILAGASAIALLLILEMLKDRWGELDCGPDTNVLQWLQAVSLVLAMGAAVAGLVGLFASGARRKVYAVAGIAIGLSVLLVVWIIPLNSAEGPLGNFGQLVCSSSAA